MGQRERPFSHGRAVPCSACCRSSCVATAPAAQVSWVHGADHFTSWGPTVGSIACRTRAKLCLHLCSAARRVHGEAERCFVTSVIGAHHDGVHARAQVRHFDGHLPPQHCIGWLGNGTTPTPMQQQYNILPTHLSVRAWRAGEVKTGRLRVDTHITLVAVLAWEQHCKDRHEVRLGAAAVTAGHHHTGVSITTPTDLVSDHAYP